MTEVQKARRQVKVRPGKARKAARSSNRAERMAIRCAIRTGADVDAVAPAAPSRGTSRDRRIVQ